MTSAPDESPAAPSAVSSDESNAQAELTKLREFLRLELTEETALALRESPEATPVDIAISLLATIRFSPILRLGRRVWDQEHKCWAIIHGMTSGSLILQRQDGQPYDREADKYCARSYAHRRLLPTSPLGDE